MTTMNDTITNGTNAAEGFVKDAGTTTRGKLSDLATGVGAAVRFFRSLEDDAATQGRSLLSRIGLQPKQSPLVGIGMFASGALVGAGAALLFAPMSGEDLRGRIRTQFKDILDGKGKIGEAMKKGVDELKQVTGQTANKVESDGQKLAAQAKTAATNVVDKGIDKGRQVADQAKHSVESLADRVDDQLKPRTAGSTTDFSRNGH